MRIKVANHEGSKVMLDAGANQGVQDGMKLSIWRNGEKIGEVSVSMLFRTEAIAIITAWKKRFKVGDVAKVMR